MKQTRKGNTELARRVRSFHGLSAKIARIARVNHSHVARVVAGSSTSGRVLRLAIRELERIERKEAA